MRCARPNSMISSRLAAASACGGRPAFEQPQDPGGAQVLAGDGQRGGEGDDQVGAQPVEQPPFVAAGPLVVTGDGPQLTGELPVRDQPPEPGVAVQREQAADPRVLGVVLLAGRAAAAGHQLRVDRQHRIPGFHQRLNQQAVPGLDHHPHLSRVGLQPGDPLHQSGHRLRAVLDPQYRDDSLTRAAERYQMELFRPVDPYSQHITLPLSSSAATPRAGRSADPAAATPAAVRGRRRAVLIDSPQGTATSWASGLQGHPPGTPSPLSPRRTSARSVPQGRPSPGG